MERRTLRIEIVKRADGGRAAPLHSRGWQRDLAETIGAKRRAFHASQPYSLGVETRLAYEQGFFGLIASGWDIEDTTGNGARGPFLMKLWKSKISSVCLIANAHSRSLWNADDLSEFAPRALTRKLDEAAIRRVQSARKELFQRWDAIEIGGKLELEYVG